MAETDNNKYLTKIASWASQDILEKLAASASIVKTVAKATGSSSRSAMTAAQVAKNPLYKGTSTLKATSGFTKNIPKPKRQRTFRDTYLG